MLLRVGSKCQCVCSIHVISAGRRWSATLRLFHYSDFFVPLLPIIPDKPLLFLDQHTDARHTTFSVTFYIAPSAKSGGKQFVSHLVVAFWIVINKCVLLGQSALLGGLCVGGSTVKESPNNSPSVKHPPPNSLRSIGGCHQTNLSTSTKTRVTLYVIYLCGCHSI